MAEIWDGESLPESMRKKAESEPPGGTLGPADSPEELHRRLTELRRLTEDSHSTPE